MNKSKKQTKPRIVVSSSTKKDQIVELTIKDMVKKIADSGYVALPKELVGKYILIKIEVLK